MGFSSVAIYSKAQSLNTMISGNLLGGIQNVYFPAIAQHHRDKKPLYPAFSKATSYMSVIAFPIFGFLALYSEEIILIMFGDQWLHTADLIKILVISPCIYCLWRFIPVTLNAIGKPGVVLRMNLLLQIIRIVLVLYAAQFSLEYIVISLIVTTFIGMVIHLVIFRRYIDFNFFDYFIIKIPHILITSIFPIGMTFLFKEYYIQQGEFIESIIIPKPNGNQQLITHKMSKRYEDDISAVCMAINIASKNNKPESFKIAFGGMSGIPQRAQKLEKVLLKDWENNDIATIAYKVLKEEFSPFTDVRASSEYRLQVSANLVKKTILMYQNEPVENLAEYSQSSQ